MIQRIQTLFLGLAAIALIVMVFYPVASITEFTIIQSDALETDYYSLMITGFSDPSPESTPHMNSLTFIPMAILVVMMLALILYSIFRYKQRLHQLKLVKISIFLNIILVAGIFLNYPKLFTDSSIRIEIGTGAYFPLISLVMLVVANRYILKDEKLVRSADRLR
jgi:uncharacterized membrane protein YhaH (DUF805 family)